MRQAAHGILCRGLDEDTLASYGSLPASLERTRQALANEGWDHWTLEAERRAKAHRAAVQAEREAERKRRLEEYTAHTGKVMDSARQDMM